jgi:serine/threonine-protein kinase
MSAYHLQNCPNCGAEQDLMLQEPRVEQEVRFCSNCQHPLVLVAGKYLLEQQIAEGGFGLIFRARHIRLDFDALRVVKFIRKEMFAQRSIAERFAREVQVTTYLSQRNPHIVRIFDDFGQIPKIGHYYVMEYLEGDNLAERLDRVERLPMAEALSIFRQLCSALDEAHKMQVVHRDVKPENIFLVRRAGEDNFLKLIDFGIAKPLEGMAKTLTQGALGTPEYMPPEQCDSSGVDHRADIYAACVILYEMLTGHTPFRRPNDTEARSAMHILVAKLTEAPLSLCEMHPDLRLSREFEQFIFKGIARKPIDRWQSMTQMLEALDSMEVESKLVIAGDVELPYNAHQQTAYVKAVSPEEFEINLPKREEKKTTPQPKPFERLPTGQLDASSITLMEPDEDVGDLTTQHEAISSPQNVTPARETRPPLFADTMINETLSPLHQATVQESSLRLGPSNGQTVEGALWQETPHQRTDAVPVIIPPSLVSTLPTAQAISLSPVKVERAKEPRSSPPQEVMHSLEAPLSKEQRHAIHALAPQFATEPSSALQPAPPSGSLLRSPRAAPMSKPASAIETVQIAQSIEETNTRSMPFFVVALLAILLGLLGILVLLYFFPLQPAALQPQRAQAHNPDASLPPPQTSPPTPRRPTESKALTTVVSPHPTKPEVRPALLVPEVRSTPRPVRSRRRSVARRRPPQLTQTTTPMKTQDAASTPGCGTDGADFQWMLIRVSYDAPKVGSVEQLVPPRHPTIQHFSQRSFCVRFPKGGGGFRLELKGKAGRLHTCILNLTKFQRQRTIRLRHMEVGDFEEPDNYCN